jgi:hypothetical protein
MGLTQAQIEMVFGRPCRVKGSSVPLEVLDYEDLIAPCGCEFKKTSEVYYLRLPCQASHQSLYLGANMASHMRLSDVNKLP